MVLSTSRLDHKIDQLPFALHLDAVETGCVPTADEDGGTRLVCGFLGCDLRPFNPLIATLPRLLHLRAASPQQWIGHFMCDVVAESRDKRPGGEAMLERMSEMMFVDAVRRHVDSLPENSLGWLGGLRDRFVGRALALIHDAPATPWTVEEMAKRVGLSRSAFHERFAAIIGQSPMQYLANWRMQVGAGLLRNTNSPVAWVAQGGRLRFRSLFRKGVQTARGEHSWSMETLRDRARMSLLTRRGHIIRPWHPKT